MSTATDAALRLVEDPLILSLVASESELLLFFDCLMQDFIHTEMAMEVE